MEIFKRDSKFHPLNVDFSSHDARYPIIGFLKREDFQIAEFSLTYSQIYLGCREIFFPKFKDRKVVTSNGIRTFQLPRDYRERIASYELMPRSPWKMQLT